MDYADVMERLEAALSQIPAAERPDAERMLAIGRTLAETNTDRTLSPESDVERRKELRSLVERLSRRSAKAIPSASFGRALLAQLSGRSSEAEAALTDCRHRLALFGL